MRWFRPSSEGKAGTLQTSNSGLHKDTVALGDTMALKLFQQSKKGDLNHF